MSDETSTFSRLPVELEVVTTREATIAVLTATVDGEEMSWTGTAKRFPGDKWVPGIGLRLAVGRAFAKGGSRLQRQGNGFVKNLDDNAVREHKPAPSKLRPTKGVTNQARTHNRTVSA